MEDSLFRHLQPRERLIDFVERLRKFADCIPDDGQEWGTHYWIGHFCKSCDLYKFQCSYRTPVDHYRVRTKIRRSELRLIIQILERIDLYGNEDWEGQRRVLVENGTELVGIFDAIVRACCANSVAMPKA